MVQIDVRGAPGRSKGVPGSISGLKPRKTGPKILIFIPRPLFEKPLLATADRRTSGRGITFQSISMYVRFGVPLPEAAARGAAVGVGWLRVNYWYLF